MPENTFEFTKENIDRFLRELAKEYRKLIGKTMPAEIVLIGGASVLINYGFRGMTTDIDAIIQAASCMNDAILTIGNRHHLPHGWLNEDFKRTVSYSPKLLQHSTYYKTFSNVLTVRTVSAEYLIAMKLCSGRQYKNDLSDIIGILAEHEKAGTPITEANVKKAFIDLYGSLEKMPESSYGFLQDTFSQSTFQDKYDPIRQAEKDAKEAILQFESDHPDSLKESNVGDILQSLRDRNKETLIALEEAQKAFDGVAEELGLKTEEDIQKIVDEMRGK